MPSIVDVSLSSSFERDGRAFACPGERVIFICEVNQSVSLQIAAEPFICQADPVIYLATDPVGNSNRTRPTDTFQANLTNVQRHSGSDLLAYYNATLTTTMTNETSNITVECSDLLTSPSSTTQRKNLNQSRKNKNTSLLSCW